MKIYDCPYYFPDGTKCCEGSLYPEHLFCKYLTDLAKHNEIGKTRYPLAFYFAFGNFIKK